jgi:hypothetical protein
MNNQCRWLQQATVHSTSILPKLPKRGTTWTKFSVGIQLIVILWHDLFGFCSSQVTIRLWNMGSIPMYIQVTWTISQSMCLYYSTSPNSLTCRQYIGTSLPPLMKCWIFEDCQISRHILHGARQGCSINMPNLRAHCIVCVITTLQ